MIAAIWVARAVSAWAVVSLAAFLGAPPFLAARLGEVLVLLQQRAANKGPSRSYVVSTICSTCHPGKLAYIVDKGLWNICDNSGDEQRLEVRRQRQRTEI